MRRYGAERHPPEAAAVETHGVAYHPRRPEFFSPCKRGCGRRGVGAGRTCIGPAVVTGGYIGLTLDSRTAVLLPITVSGTNRLLCCSMCLKLAACRRLSRRHYQYEASMMLRESGGDVAALSFDHRLRNVGERRYFFRPTRDVGQSPARLFSPIPYMIMSTGASVMIDGRRRSLPVVIVGKPTH